MLIVLESTRNGYVVAVDPSLVTHIYPVFLGENFTHSRVEISGSRSVLTTESVYDVAHKINQAICGGKNESISID